MPGTLSSTRRGGEGVPGVAAPLRCILAAFLCCGLFVILATGCGKPPGATGMGLALVAEGFTSPVNLVPLEDGSGRLLITDQIGTIHVLNTDGKLADRLFLDLGDRLAKVRQSFDERGLLGLALHPKFKENRRFYVYYSAPLRKDGPAGYDHSSRVSEFKVTDGDYAVADPASERILLQIDEPQDNHNCGRIAFGPDGLLYIAVGDGGGANDTAAFHAPQGNGQDTTSLLGKILRIDVDKGEPYGIPADNVFADGKQGRPEIYAYGLRNPWGMTFDRGGRRELFVSDVGQTMFEEVNIVENGGNYGWRLREGFHGFDPDKPNQPPSDAPKTDALGRPLLDPVLEYKNANGFRNDPEAYGISVTGGYVYRGKALPALEGRYVFGDWSKNWSVPQGIVLVATPPSNPAEKRWSVAPLNLVSHPGTSLGAYLVAFGQDADGELYVMTNDSNQLVGKTGKVFKLVPL